MSSNPLPPNVIFAQAVVPPINVLPLSCVTFSFVLNFSFSSVFGQFREKESGIRKQFQLSGVQYFHVFLSHYIHDVIGHALGSIILVGGAAMMKINVDGFWLPMLLFTFAQPLSCYFLLAVANKKQSFFSLLVYYAVTASICVTGTCVVSFVGISGQMFTASRVMEFFFSLLPVFAGIFSFIKLLYRVQFQPPNATERDISSFSMSGCLPEIIGLCISLVLYPLLTFAIVNNWLGRGRTTDGLK